MQHDKSRNMDHGDTQHKTYIYMRPYYEEDEKAEHFQAVANLGEPHKVRCCWCCACEYTHETQTSNKIGRKSKYVTCPNCRQPVKTRISYITSKKTNRTAMWLGAIGCCLLPYCMRNCKMVRHECPVCQAYIGTSK